MKNTHTKPRHMKLASGALLASAALLVACSEPNIPDYNNPGESQFEQLETRAQLESQAVGLADADRRSHDFQILLDETLARNVYRMDGSEPRYITQTLRANLPGNTNFVGGSIFAGPYRTIRSADFLIDAVEAAPDVLPESRGGAEVAFGDRTKAAVIGYAQTWKALSYMRLIEQRDTIGIAIFAGTDTITPIRCKEDILEYVANLLDEGYENLTTNADTAQFLFTLPSGFSGFNTPSTFAQFNRAIKAKVAVYQGFDRFARLGTAADTLPQADRYLLTRVNTAALNEAQAALDASFYDAGATDFLTGGRGVYHTYAAGGDYLNPNFEPSVYRINPRVVREAEGATFTIVGTDSVWSSPDQRLARKVELNGSNDCRTRSDTRSCFLDKVNATNITPLPIVRNDELTLLQAEIHFGLGQFAQALAVVNRVRTNVGLTARTALSFGDATFTTQASRRELLLEILKQKRYQLLFESPARWVDFRMFGELDALGLERPNAGDDGEAGTDDDFEGYPGSTVPVFPIPSAEVFARGGDVTKTCGP